MAKAKTRKQKQKDLMRFVYGIITILFAVVGLFELGLIGQSLYGLFRILLGQFPQVFFVLIIVVSVVAMISPSYLKNMPVKYWVAALLSLISYLLIISIPENNDLVGQGVLDYYFATFRDVYQAPETYAYGGLLGAVLYAGSSFLIAKTGTYILIGSMILVTIALVFGLHRIVGSFITGAKHVKSGAEGVGKFTKRLMPVRDEKPNNEHDPMDDIIHDHQEVSLIRKMNGPTSSKSSSVFIDYDDAKKEQLSLDLEDKSLDQKPVQLFDVEKHFDNEIVDSKKPEDSTSLKPTSTGVSFEGYRLPPKTLLDRGVGAKSNSNQGSAKDKGKRLIDVLSQFGIDADLVNIHIGPAVTKFEVKPDSNVKISRISSIQDNIMMELAVKSLRIEAPIPGKSAVGIEIPNIEMVPVRMKDIITTVPKFYESDNVWVALGKNLLGEPISVALNKMPHLLVAGATGSGKSVCMNAIITSILLTKKPDELRLLLVDPKKVEFTAYSSIPHLMAPVISDPMQATAALKLVVEEMDRRYDTFSKSGVRNITSYNENVRKHHAQDDIKPMPWIIVIIDELADLMAVAGKDVEVSIQRITQLARAAGIHLIVATQRPSVDVVTGIIKANIPSRIAFAVSSAVDSRTILDTTGAEKLLGYGDMLYIPMGEPNPTRVQGVFVSDDEVNAIANYASKQASPQYYDSFIQMDSGQQTVGIVAAQDDPLYDEAVLFVIKQQKASTSFLQRQYRIGYNRAASLVDAMEQEGIIGPAQGSKPRDVRFRTPEEFEEYQSQK